MRFTCAENRTEDVIPIEELEEVILGSFVGIGPAAPVPPVPLCSLTHEPADKERQEAIAVDIYRCLGVRLEGSVVRCAGRIQERG